MAESFELSFDTDLTPITIQGSELHIHTLKFAKGTSLLKSNDLLKTAKNQIIEYLHGKRKIFDLPLSPNGTEFQQKVWSSLLDIGYGHTVSYKQLSSHIGDQKAIRAVARANGANPLPILFPCHRVVGAKGELIGYLGGLKLKRQLLELESGLKQMALF